PLPPASSLPNLQFQVGAIRPRRQRRWLPDWRRHTSRKRLTVMNEPSSRLIIRHSRAQRAPLPQPDVTTGTPESDNMSRDWIWTKRDGEGRPMHGRHSLKCCPLLGEMAVLAGVRQRDGGAG
ncbi:unnamed protein product, partial [Xyrichtys novacula]